MVDDAISALTAANEGITALQKQMMSASVGDREELRFKSRHSTSLHHWPTLTPPQAARSAIVAESAAAAGSADSALVHALMVRWYRSKVAAQGTELKSLQHQLSVKRLDVTPSHPPPP